MQFGKSYSTAPEPHLRDAFQFSPPAGTEVSSQACDIAYLSTDGNRFNFGKLADDFKAHQRVI
jgi:hypothetical protein